jgi:hypothetical protein
MPIQSPPITEDNNLNFILIEIINQINRIEQDNLKVLADIKAASNFADLQTKVEE